MEHLRAQWRQALNSVGPSVQLPPGQLCRAMVWDPWEPGEIALAERIHAGGGSARELVPILNRRGVGQWWTRNTEVATGLYGQRYSQAASETPVAVLLIAADPGPEHYEYDHPDVPSWMASGTSEGDEVWRLAPGTPLTLVGLWVDSGDPDGLMGYEADPHWRSFGGGGLRVTAVKSEDREWYENASDAERRLYDALDGPVPGKVRPIYDPADDYGGYITQRRDGHLYLDGQPLRKLYRVVDPGEWAEAQERGYLQSDAASGSGYTRASAKPDERWRYHTRSGERAVTLEIDYDPADGWSASAEGYAATHSRIPLSRVRKVGTKTAGSGRRYYHASFADLAPGTVIQPASSLGVSNWDYNDPGFGVSKWRADHVWMALSVEDAWGWLSKAMTNNPDLALKSDPRVYEVEPQGFVEVTSVGRRGDLSEAYCDSAIVLHEVGAKTSMSGTDPNAQVAFEDRLGNCYHFAAQYVLKNPGSTLVHGSIQGFGNPRIGHAWAIDADGEVFEPTSGEHWPDVETFTAFHNAEVYRTYDPDEVRILMLRHSHWGPWHDSPYGLMD